MPESGQRSYKPELLLFVRFFVVAVIGWIYIRFVPIKWFVDYYLPMSFHLLNFLLVLGVFTLGWPFMHPSQRSDNTAVNIIPRGVAQTILWLGLGVAMHAIGRHWVGMPNPGDVFFGITLFMCTLWYALGGVGPFPFADRLKPWENGLFGWGAIMILTILLFLAFVNFKGLPLEGHRTDPNGQLAAQEWFDRAVWIIVWIQAFGSIMCFQGWPFVLLPTPWYQVSYLGVCIGLGTACYEVTVAAELDMPTSASAVAATMISFSMYHAIGFELRPFASLCVQPLRGAVNFLTEEVMCTVVWVYLCRGILEPVEDRLLAAGPPYSFFNVNHLTAWYSLHVVAPLLIVHELFFARFPLPPPPPGPPLGPFELAGQPPASESAPGSLQPESASGPSFPDGAKLQVEPAVAPRDLTSDLLFHSAPPNPALAHQDPLPLPGPQPFPQPGMGVGYAATAPYPAASHVGYPTHGHAVPVYMGHGQGTVLQPVVPGPYAAPWSPDYSFGGLGGGGVQVA